MDERVANKVIRRSRMCPICHKRWSSQIHHIMHGSPWNRALSEKYSDACLIYICKKCHDKVHFEVKEDEKRDTLDWKLKAQAERDFSMFYPEDDWMETFGRSYNDEDLYGGGSGNDDA